MINPFKPGDGTFPPYLAGREEEINWFKKSLETALTLPQNMAISGIRGTGKTVLLMELEQICENKKWLYIRREFNRDLCDTQTFVIALLSDLTTKLKGLSTLSPVKNKIGFLAKPESKVIDDDYFFGLLSRHPGLTADKFEAILFEMFPIIEKAKYKGLVLLYDEFHNIEDGKIEGNYPLSLLLETFGHAQQKGLRYYLVLSGLPPLFPNLVSAKTYAERMFSVWRLKELPEDKAKEAIVKPLNKTSFKFERKLIDEIVKTSKGYPYLIQFFGHFLLQNIPKKEIELKDFVNILPYLLKHLDNSFYRGRFSRATHAEQDALFAMAKVGDRFSPQEIRKHIKISKANLNKRLNGLIEKNLIYKISRGQYTFALPAFKEFLQREKERSK